MPWPFGRKKEGKRETEYPRLQVEGVIRNLEEKAGLYLLNKGGYLETRLTEIHQTLTKAAIEGDIVKYVNNAKRLVLVVASAWLRGMQNPWLAKKVNAFLENYRVLHDVKGGLPYLAREAEVIVNLSFTNLDVEPPPPIFVQSTVMQSPFAYPRNPYATPLGQPSENIPNPQNPNPTPLGSETHERKKEQPSR